MNNMLAGVLGNIYLAKDDAKAIPAIFNRLDLMEKGALRAADMIAQLLAFARKGVIEMKPIRIALFIKEALTLLRTAVPSNVTFEQYICSETLPVQADRTQLQQVLMNLINNARDAIAGIDQPCISVRLEPFQTDDTFLQKHPYFQAGHYARLSVSDNGCGISDSQKEHIFEPFFTTKDIGKGTGLGLAMVMGAIKSHHGFIELDSQLGKGTTFHVFLPLLIQQDETSHRPEAPVKHGNGELILLVDDEATLCEMNEEILHSIGYKSLVAHDGEQALARFKSHQDDIAIILLDIVMPRMGGIELAKQIRDIQPNVPIMFLTGYDTSNLLDSGLEDAHTLLLNKPLRVAKLATHLHDTLKTTATVK